MQRPPHKNGPQNRRTPANGSRQVVYHRDGSGNRGSGRISASESGQNRRRRNRRKKLVSSLAVVAVLLVGLFVAALLMASHLNGQDVVSSSSFVPAVSSSVPQVVASSSSEPVPVEPPREPTEWDEEALPELFNFINRRYLPEGYINDQTLVDIGNGQQMQERAAAAFLAMQAAASEEGVQLRPLSGYRSTSTQYNIFYNKLNLYRGQGYSEEESRYRTIRYHAYPGTSEHEAALAIDIGDAAVTSADIEDSFADTPAFEWLQAHCVEYGFIFRYQSDTEETTGIAFEPWHYRYVGANHAEIITEQGITLEEYIFEQEDALGITPEIGNSILGGIPNQPWPEDK